ncbi:MAG: hypothetical protein BRD57_06310, partial [Proteobacteria bacterium SW_6_67_9]
MRRPAPHDASRRLGAALAALTAVAAGAGCSGDAPFSQHPGFDAWLAAHPPDPEAATRAERDLLRQYRPVLYVPEDAPGPLSFYDDYIAQGQLRTPRGRWN